jgi:hypothetical protein
MLAYDTLEVLNNSNLSLAQKIRQQLCVTSSSKEAYSFIITSLSLIFPGISEHSLKMSITDSNGDGGIDAVVISRSEKTVSVFDFKKNRGFSYAEVESFKNNIKKYLLNDQQSLKGLSELSEKAIIKARDRLAQNWSLRIFVIRSTKKESPIIDSVRDLFKDILNDYESIEPPIFLEAKGILQYSISAKSEQNDYVWEVRIVRSAGSSGEKEEKIVVKKGRSIKSLLVRISLQEIVKLQEKFLDDELDLFDANVRDFRRKKELSTKIVESINRAPEIFYIFHNGLTFSCSKIEPIIGGSTYKIVNPQIINGCQTVNTIYEAYKKDQNNENLKKAMILCRFYSLEKQDIERVCEATNTQVKINLWELRSNDSIQKILEKALDAKEINYNRKSNTRANERILITDLAQWIYSCKFEKPAEAKNNKAGLFDLFAVKSVNKPSVYHQIFDEKISLEELTRICEIATFVKKKIKRIKKDKLPYKKDADLHFIAGIFYLESKNESLDWKFDKVLKATKQTVKQLRSKHGVDLSPNKIFSKTEDTWKMIKKKLSS